MRNPGWFNVTLGAVLSLALLLAHAPGVLAQNRHTLPLVMAASETQYGFIRIINSSDRAGTVSIHAIDDSGDRRGPVTIDLAAHATVSFGSHALENGGQGLSAGVEDGTGHWRLELETDLDIEPMAYVRTTDGFLASVHDVIEGEAMRWHVVFFNPASNTDKVSLLRVVNTSGMETEVVITGRDDAGVAAPGGEVRFTLPADAARMLSAQALEGGYASGESEFDFQGSLGDGTGKWQLFVSAGRPVQVMSLLNVKLTGHLANLSTTAVGPAGGAPGLAPVNQPAFDARFVGKRIQFAGDREYADFVSAGRVVDTDDGGASLFPGSYTYRNAGSDSGVLYFFFDAGVSCPARIMFDSVSTGTLTHSCGDTPEKTETWQLVEIPGPGADFAPADQAAFDARFVGKRVVFDDDPSSYWDFVSSGRLDDVEGKGGSYTYRRTGPNTGRIDVQYDASGEQCQVDMTFDSPTAGMHTPTCSGETESPGPWELVDIPDAGFAPADQAAFDAGFVGKRILFSLASGIDLPAYADITSAGRILYFALGTGSFPGDYVYRNTGPNSATVVIDLDVGDRCTAHLTFDAAASGTIDLSCVSGTQLVGLWRAENIPGT